MRLKSLIFLISLLLLSQGCAHQEAIAPEKFNSLNNEFRTFKNERENLIQENTELKNRLESSEKNIKGLNANLESYMKDKQQLLDKNIKCLKENKMLLGEISNFRTIIHEKGQTAWRLDKAYKYALSFFNKERLDGKLYIIKQNDKLKIIIPQHSIFPTSKSAWVTPRGGILLLKIVHCLKTINTRYIEIAGHTDNTSYKKKIKHVNPTNWHLGLARAIAVVTKFEKQGIKRDTMCAISYADTRPIADNSTPKGRAMNNRVEIVIMP